MLQKKRNQKQKKHSKMGQIDYSSIEKAAKDNVKSVKKKPVDLFIDWINEFTFDSDEIYYEGLEEIRSECAIRLLAKDEEEEG